MGLFDNGYMKPRAQAKAVRAYLDGRTTMTRAETLLDNINAAIASGKTVMFTTYGHATKVSPRTVKAWAKAGNELFRIEGDHLCIANGKKFVSVMGCKITAA